MIVLMRKLTSSFLANDTAILNLSELELVLFISGLSASFSRLLHNFRLMKHFAFLSHSAPLSLSSFHGMQDILMELCVTQQNEDTACNDSSMKRVVCNWTVFTKVCETEASQVSQSVMHSIASGSKRVPDRNGQKRFDSICSVLFGPFFLDNCSI